MQEIHIECVIWAQGLYSSDGGEKMRMHMNLSHSSLGITY